MFLLVSHFLSLSVRVFNSFIYLCIALIIFLVFILFYLFSLRYLSLFLYVSQKKLYEFLFSFRACCTFRPSYSYSVYHPNNILWFVHIVKVLNGFPFVWFWLIYLLTYYYFYWHFICGLCSYICEPEASAPFGAWRKIYMLHTLKWNYILHLAHSHVLL